MVLRNLEIISGPDYIVTLPAHPQQKPGSLMKTSPIRFSLKEIMKFGMDGEESGVVGGESHVWQSSRVKGHTEL